MASCLRSDRRRSSCICVSCLLYSWFDFGNESKKRLLFSFKEGYTESKVISLFFSLKSSPHRFVFKGGGGRGEGGDG